MYSSIFPFEPSSYWRRDFYTELVLYNLIAPLGNSTSNFLFKNLPMYAANAFILRTAFGSRIGKGCHYYFAYLILLLESC